MSKEITTIPQLENTLIHIKEQIRALPETCNWYIMHDAARAIEAAATILKHKDLQVESSIAINEVERIINSITVQQKPGPKTGKADKETIKQEANERELGWMKYDFRKAHGNLSDVKFEELKKEARETGEPLSRNRLIRESNKEARKNQPPEEQKQGTEAEPVHKAPSRADLEQKISNLHYQVNELKEENGRLREEDTNSELGKALEELRVCRSSSKQVELANNELSKECGNLKRMTNAQKARIRQIEDKLENAEERIAITSENDPT